MAWIKYCDSVSPWGEFLMRLASCKLGVLWPCVRCDLIIVTTGKALLHHIMLMPCMKRFNFDAATRVWKLEKFLYYANIHQSEANLSVVVLLSFSTLRGDPLQDFTIPTFQFRHIWWYGAYMACEGGGGSRVIKTFHQNANQVGGLKNGRYFKTPKEKSKPYLNIYIVVYV